MHDEDNYTQLFHPSQPDGYIGCYKDSKTFSDLSGIYKLVPEDRAMEECAKVCRKYLYLGLQRDLVDDLFCHCGNEFGYYGIAQELECPICGNRRCGSDGSNAVYRVAAISAKFLGCFNDKFNHLDHRDLEFFAGARFTPISCAATCVQYKYFGVQNGGECYCGSSYGLHGRSELRMCLTRCSSDLKLLCGGTDVNAIFENIV